MKKRILLGRLGFLPIVIILTAGITALAQKRTLETNQWVLESGWFNALARIQSAASAAVDAIPTMVFRHRSSPAIAKTQPAPVTRTNPTTTSKRSPIVELPTSDVVRPTRYGGQAWSPAPPPTDAFLSPTVMKAALAVSPEVPAAPTASGNWISNASGNWSNAANWQGGTIADGFANTAGFDTLDITTDVTVTLDTSRTIGSLVVGDTNGTHRYTIAASGGSTLTFDNDANAALLQQSATSAGDTISVPIFLFNLRINNLSTTNPFNVNGNLSYNSSPGSFPSITFNDGGTAGEVRVAGNISDGTAGGMSVSVQGGTVVFTGTNSYTGGTQVGGNSTATLLVNGNDTAATGHINVFGTGSLLGGTGTVGGDVFTYGGTITGGTAGTVGALTLKDDLHLRTGEGDGIYLANLSGNMSDLLAITGTMFLGGESELHIVGAADGITTYTLATFASHDGVFNPMLVSGVPAGYELVYHATDLQLVPIPEPATWIGGALMLGAIGFTQRRRLRQLIARRT